MVLVFFIYRHNKFKNTHYKKKFLNQSTFSTCINVKTFILKFSANKNNSLNKTNKKKPWNYDLWLRIHKYHK